MGSTGINQICGWKSMKKQKFPVKISLGYSIQEIPINKLIKNSIATGAI